MAGGGWRVGGRCELQRSRLRLFSAPKERLKPHVQYDVGLSIYYKIGIFQPDILKLRMQNADGLEIDQAIYLHSKTQRTDNNAARAILIKIEEISSEAIGEIISSVDSRSMRTIAAPN